MKRQLTLIAAVLACAVAVGAVIGFVRRRIERLESERDAVKENGSVPVGGERSGAAASRGQPAGVNGDRA